MSTIEALIADQATNAPHRTAVTSAEGSITYGELMDRALEISQRIRAAGAEPGSIVGLAAARSIEVTAGLLGILLADCAYLYLDPKYPVARRSFMAHECETLFALVDEVAQWDVADVVPIALRGKSADAQPVPLAIDKAAREHELCYVCFTSGSTGEPKGVLIDQGSVVNMARGLAAAFGVTPKTRMLQFASWNFDAAACEIFVALAAGATLCLAPEATLTAGPELARFLREQRISFATLTPSVLDALSPDDLPDLTAIAAVGERCHEELVARWAPGRRFFNGYGPTEVTVAATIAELRPEDEVHIGRPIAGVEIRIAGQDDGRPVRIGEPGELHVSGVGLARGYLNRPTLTENRFVPDPVEPGKRWYRTGDIVRQREDGNLVYVGRVDNQIKLHGLRIELEEVEAALRQHDLVKQCVVIAHQAGHGAQSTDHLVAHIVPVDDTLTPEMVSDFVREWLPPHMVPSQIVLTPQLPLTTWGKLDRAALAQQLDDEVLVASDMDMTSQVLALLRQATESSTLDIDDDIFDHGGHSLLAAQVSVEVKSMFGVELPVLAVFDNPTPRQLATLVEAQTASLTKGQQHAYSS